MRNLFIVSVFILSCLGVQGQIFGNHYQIIAKGWTNDIPCSGQIVEDPDIHKRIDIFLSNNLSAAFEIADKKQIDERTVIYTCYKKGTYDLKKYDIIKYRSPYGANLFFFTFPPLYDGNTEIMYKALKK